ncbi:aldehyde dehydrogenase (NADP(+)) [Pseudoalteromonas obscura]|uniref:Aldehyde dehydrogenase (NADP(+)) n=1 Tax=Pseudoalteromonas obscura TaxID=3048491 RepID=A0ABT7EKE5_9GAMM|nr:aldehyde dehydrogenase (NADP(+)) [Pseudoalteromonas sp. P94(2023)]MDK2595491.1 aldehyde dehydrogenase (NADP(+)) [Pseudoalteromonas sp. P94(2023)]
MTFTGLSYIAGQWLENNQGNVFQGFCPGTNEYLPTRFYEVSDEQISQATDAAHAAFKQYRSISNQQRSEFLNTIADEILALGDILIETTMLETNLPRQRLEGERMRTVNQLRVFADVLQQDLAPLKLSCAEEGDETRTPIPKPKTALTYLPVGVVAVFGASNFPYAFSTLGGDTASALAAGCAVVVKAHPAHPATNELMTKAIASAIEKCAMPDGLFSMLQGSEHKTSHQLVSEPMVKAVGFTGSLGAANALLKTIHQRVEPIPFYGELGSVNPQIVLQDYSQKQGGVLATQLVSSMAMGHGQFCTSPGVWFVPSEDDNLVDAAIKAIEATPSDTLLTPGILQAFNRSTTALNEHDAVSLLAKGPQTKDYHASAHLFSCDIQDFVKDVDLQEEVFGPCALLVKYRSYDELLLAIDGLAGQLTASIYGETQELKEQAKLIEALSFKVGRIIYSQAPTGVEVCMSMNHGGPFPSSTDVRSTSVGTKAMTRFLRPLCVQGDQ